MRKNIYNGKEERFIIITIRCKVPLITVCVMQGLLRGFVFALVFLIIHVYNMVSSNKRISPSLILVYKVGGEQEI